MLLLLAASAPVSAQQQSSSAGDVVPASGEPYRPAYHFTPAQHWLGAPASTVYRNGQYHLFYPYDPGGTTPTYGFLGHAVSSDLVNWQHLPIALYPDALGTIGPASVVVDRDGSAGFGADALVAVFTQDREGDRVLSMAYSTDDGQSWTAYDANPVLDLPNWFTVMPAPALLRFTPDGADSRWVMVVSTGDEIWFYTSSDLKQWTKAGQFGKDVGSHAGPWGPADLFQFPAENGAATSWVLAVSTDAGAPARGPGVQLFFGDLALQADDSLVFTSQDPSDTAHWADFGPDFYGPTLVRNAPDEQLVWLGWMENPTYAQQAPTPSWRGALTLPRQLSLITGDAGPTLAQQPISALQALRGEPVQLAAPTVISGTTDLLDGLAGGALEIVAEFQVDENTSADRFGVHVRQGEGQVTTVSYASARPQEQDLAAYTIENPSFETGDLAGWTAAGSAFSDGDVSDAVGWDWGCCFEADGVYHLWNWLEGGDDQTGELRSATFTVGGTGEIDFLIGGGKNPDRLYAALVRAADDVELLRAYNETWADSEKLARVYWDASPYMGQEVYVKLVDDAKGGWGHMNVDGFNVYHPRDVVTIDRTQSGEAGFDSGFAARHSAQMPPDDGRIRLHIFVDESSVEVFGSDGRLVMTERIFPDLASISVDVFADGGQVMLSRLEAYPLRPAAFAPAPQLPTEVATQSLENPDFETGDLTGWTTSGNAFSVANVSEAACFDPCTEDQQYGQQGAYHLVGLADETSGYLTGELRSAVFELDPAGEGWVEFLVGGGHAAADTTADLDRLYVGLVRAADGKVLFRATGDGTGVYRRVTWDASRYLGEPLYFAVADYDASKEGVINVDDFRISGVEGQPALPAAWSFDEGSGNLAQDAVSGAQDMIHYVFNDAQYKPDSDPLWRDGVNGGALLFDGYSTWIERPAAQMFQPVDQLTISAWVAPRSYEWGDLKQLSAIVNQHDAAQKAGYILGMGRHGAWSFQAGVSGGWYEVWADDQHPLPTDQWSYIAAVLDAQTGRMQLTMNGELVGEAALPAGSSITPTTEDFVIGRHNQAAVINGVFHANMFNGLIDELQITNQPASLEEIKVAYDAALQSRGGVAPIPETAQERSRYDGDRYRPQYHFIPPEHWMNEPHAPIFFDGQYHIFYQHNPQGPYWHQIHWGHAVSDDMVHWRDLPWALSPTAGSVAPDGVWSGDAVLDAQGNPLLFFTAGDDSQVPNQNVGLAAPLTPTNPLADWRMADELTIVQQPDQLVDVQAASARPITGTVWYGQFRDPFVWQEQEAGGDPIWYLIIGSGVRLGEESGLTLESASIPYGGTALLYSSSDLATWTNHGPLFIGNYAKYPWTGMVWELPVLLPLGVDSQGNAKHILMVNPWFEGYSPYAVKNVYYWIGTWDSAALRFVPDQEAPQRWDFGDHFTGPSGFVDDSGRSIVLSIAQDRRSEQAHYDSAWAHNAGLPVALSLNPDDTLRVEPIDELASLRTQQLASIGDTSLAEANELLAGVGGDLLEVVAELQPVDATQFGLMVRRTGAGQEETLLYYDAAAGTFNVDRNKSSLDPDAHKGVQGDAMPLDGGALRLHVFVDRSMLEAYANDRASITTRIYPTLADALGVQVWGNGDVRVKSLAVWELSSAYGDAVPANFPPAAGQPAAGQLPNHSFQTCDLTGWTVVGGEAFTDAEVTDKQDWGWGGPFQQADDSDRNCHLWGALGEDAATGVLRSATFTLAGDGQIDFLVAGGNQPQDLYVALVNAADSRLLMTATGHDSEQYRRVRWDAAQYVGQELYIEAVDQATGGFGHLNLDSVNVPAEGQPDPYVVPQQSPVIAPAALPAPTSAPTSQPAPEPTAVASATGSPAAPVGAVTEQAPGGGPLVWILLAAAVVGAAIVIVFFVRKRARGA